MRDRLSVCLCFGIILIIIISKLLFLSDFNKHAVKIEHQDLLKQTSYLIVFDILWLIFVSISKEWEYGLLGFVLFFLFLFTWPWPEKISLLLQLPKKSLEPFVLALKSITHGDKRRTSRMTIQQLQYSLIAVFCDSRKCIIVESCNMRAQFVFSEG